MKQCTYCGKQYPDDASTCEIDGRALQDVVPVPPPPSRVPPASPDVPASGRQQIIDDEHIKLLAIFHFVIAGLALLGIAFLIAHYCLMRMMFSNPDFWKVQNNAPPLPKDFFKVFIWFYLFFGCILGVAGLLNLLSGLFLRRKKYRIFSMVVAGLNCLQIPFGTVLGVFTIVVLTRNSVCQRYDA